MRPALVLIGLVGAAVLSPASPAESAAAAAEQAPAALTVLKAARLFDGRSDRILGDAVVIVEGSRIREVGARLKPPSGARVIDLGDVTLLPGFIDSHTHLSGEMSDNWLKDTVDGLRRTVPEASIRSAESARRTLMAGFTTVRDLGSGEFIDVGLRDAIRAGVAAGPRILASAGGLGARGGHCDETGFPYLRFGRETGVPEGVASGADAFRDAVRFRVKYGADVIKTCATGGVLSLADEVDTPQLSQAEMDAIVEEAHRLRKKVAAHAHGAEGAKVAVRAGVDSIEHGSFLDEEALRMMKERGTWFVPTLMAVDYVSGKAAARSFPPEIAAKAEAAAEAHAAAMRRAIRIGVKIAFGTDSAVSPHGLNAREFGLLVDRGLAPAAALRAGTSAAAELLGLEKEIGTLEAGKQADIVAVPGDPLADIRLTEKVIFVMKGGAIHRHDTPASR
jgi:imidazolonepropionase-like amidohydrolase